MRDPFGRKNPQRDLERIRVSIGERGVAGAAIDHGGLIGLTDDDHAQYVHNTTARTITAQHNFANGLTIGGDATLSRTAAATLGLGVGQTLAVDTLADRGGGNLTIAPAGDIVLNPTGNDILPNTNYDLNLGAINKKFLALHAAELWVETLVAQDTVATIGGRVLVGPTTTLLDDIPAAGRACTYNGSVPASGHTYAMLKHNEMGLGDITYMEAGGKVEYYRVKTSPVADVGKCYKEYTGKYEYYLQRNLDASGANDWYAGDAMFNTGVTGEGFIDLYALHSIRGTALIGPTIVGYVRGGTVSYNDMNEAWAIGNLNGLYGISGNYMGVGIGGTVTGNYLLYDTNGGFRIYAGAGSFTIDGFGPSINMSDAWGTITSYRFKSSTTGEAGALWTTFLTASTIASHWEVRGDTFNVANYSQMSIASAANTQAKLSIWTTNGADPANEFRLTKEADGSRTVYMAADRLTCATTTVAGTIFATGMVRLASGLTLGGTAATPAANTFSICGTTTYPGNVTDRANMYLASNLGLVVYGVGSTSDFYLANKNGGGVLQVPTGTTTLTLLGALDHDGSTAGFFGTTPATRPAHINDANASLIGDNVDSAAEVANQLNATNGKVNSLIAALETLGLVASS